MRRYTLAPQATEDIRAIRDYTHLEPDESEVQRAAFSNVVQNNILRVRALRRGIGYLTGFFRTCTILIALAALTGILPVYCLLYFYIPLLINLLLCIPLEFLILQAGKSIARQADPRLVGPLLDVWHELGHNVRTLNLGSPQIEAALIQLLPRMTLRDGRHLTRENREQLQSFLLYGDSYFFPGQRERSIQLKIAILRALERVGTQESIGAVSAVAANAGDPRLRQAAQECLPGLQVRKAESETSQTLLRSSAIGDTTDPLLLHPASDTSVGSVYNEDLLRPI